MTLRLYDTREQQLLRFEPLDPGNVSIYVCGPTVQSGPHIGHVRAALSFDLLRRWLAHDGTRVTFVRNVTDIDDKVLANATDAEPWWALAYRMEQQFTRAYTAVGILPPTYEPRATASVPQMQELIATLIERGHAYPAPDGSGDVYFDVRSWDAYGGLTNQSVDAMETAEDADPRGKRNPQDFALWKGAKKDEPADAVWRSPWGPGRPGWHIECSAMSRRYLGDEFDIHGGGLDLRFPHHENELAQSTAAGLGFAKYWVHNGLVTVGGQKMSKSLGNFTLAFDVLEEQDPLVVRYALAAAHYRSNLDLTDSTWAEAQFALDGITTFLKRADESLMSWDSELEEHREALGHDHPHRELPGEFVAAMDDDLNTPLALAVLHDWVRRGNGAIDEGDAIEIVGEAFLRVREMLDVLGLRPQGEGWVDPTFGRKDWRALLVQAQMPAVLGALMDDLIAQRAQAREDKDWATADRIRGMIADAGISLEDTPARTKWSIDG